LAWIPAGPARGLIGGRTGTSARMGHPLEIAGWLFGRASFNARMIEPRVSACLWKCLKFFLQIS